MFKKLRLPLLALTAAAGLFQASVASAQERFTPYGHNNKGYANNGYLARGDRDNREHLHQDRRKQVHRDHQQDRWARNRYNDRYQDKNPIGRKDHR